MSLRTGPKIGYALGGGAARGLSHIGVLKVLEEHHVTPDLIVGTSMGALVGALYAGGLNAVDIEKIVLQLDWKRLMRLADVTLPINGFIQGKHIMSFLKSIMGDLTFSRLKYDFACVATDVTTGEQVVFHDGPLIDALRASISIPVIFTPAVVDGHFLVDGGLVNEVPVNVCRMMGARYVIGVNVLPEPRRIMCNPIKERPYPACEALKIGSIKFQEQAPPLKEKTNCPPAPHFGNLQNAIKKLFYQSGKQEKERRPTETSVKTKTVRRKTKLPRLVDVLAQTLTIAEYRVAMENLKDADVVIHPEVGEIGFWQFNKAAEAVAAGEKASREIIRQGKLADIVLSSVNAPPRVNTRKLSL